MRRFLAVSVVLWIVCISLVVNVAHAVTTQDTVIGSCERITSPASVLFTAGIHSACQQALINSFTTTPGGSNSNPSTGCPKVSPASTQQGSICTANTSPFVDRGLWKVPANSTDVCPAGQNLVSGICKGACADTTTVVATGPLYRFGTFIGGGTPPPVTESCDSTGQCQITDTSPQIAALTMALKGSNAKVGDIGAAGSIWKRTGAACSASGDSFSGTAQTAAANGDTVKPGPGAQCGTINGVYQCFTPASAPPSGGCIRTAGGMAFCSSSAASPPAPKNAAGTAAATPDGQMITQGGGTSTTYNYYNSTTVAASDAAPTTGGTTGGTTSGTGGGTTAGSSGGTSVGTTGGTTTGSLDTDITEPELGEAKTFGQSVSDFSSSIGSSPVGQAAGALAAVQIASGAACPTYVIDIPLFGHSYTIDSHCTIVDGPFRSILSAVTLLYFLILGYRILASA